MVFSQAEMREIKKNKYLDVVHFQSICCHLWPLGDLWELPRVTQFSSPDTYSSIVHKYLSLESVVKIRNLVGEGCVCVCVWRVVMCTQFLKDTSLPNLIGLSQGQEKMW